MPFLPERIAPRLASRDEGLEAAQARIRALEGDLAELRGLLQSYMRQREAADEELRASEERYRMLAESIDDVVSLHDTDGRALYVSASLGKTTGFTAADILGDGWLRLLTPADRERVAPVLARVHVGVPRTFQWQCRQRDGGSVWLETRVTALPDSPGRPARLLCVSRDVDRRLRAEAALSESEERYRSLIQRAAFGIYRATPEGRFLDVNPALVQMLGYSSAEELCAIDITHEVYACPDDRARLMELVAADQLADWVEVQWRQRDGTPIMVRLSARSVRDAGGNVIFCEGITEDITDRNQHEELLRRSERMAALGQTLAGVAHELNNPLAAICGFAQLLTRSGRFAPDDRGALETIHHEAARAATIVKDLLTFSRRQDGERREPVDVNTVARYIMSTQRYALETRGIRCQLALSPALPPVLADASQLEQVLLNLVVNARQAITRTLDVPTSMRRRSGEWAIPFVAVRSWSEGSTVVLEVADNGPGIAEADLPRIWDPFWTTKDDGDGTGLGLAVVHGIVVEHGGTIGVESEVGRGTRFTIRLPGTGVQAGGQAEDDWAPGLDDAGTAARPLDVLIVDDEASILGFLSRFFSARGHAVVTATGGPQALRLAEQSSFDVVVCDLRMPEVDGGDVIRRMRQLRSGAATRYVVCTGDSATSTVRRRLEGLDIAAVVEKPYDIDVLRRAVEGSA